MKHETIKEGGISVGVFTSDSSIRTNLDVVYKNSFIKPLPLLKYVSGSTNIDIFRLRDRLPFCFYWSTEGTNNSTLVDKILLVLKKESEESY